MTLVIACTHQETVQTSEPSAPLTRELTLLFHARRHLEIEPCGCSLDPLGGMEREWNYTQKVKAEKPSILSFAAGPTFVPEAKEFKPKSLGYYKKKAGYVARGLDRLGVQALSVSSNDLKLGLPLLKALEQGSSAKWLSANLVDKKTKKPLFTPSITMREGDDDYLIVGLTAQPETIYQSDEATVIPARQALASVLEEGLRSRKIVVVLSEIPAEEWSAMPELRDRVNLILGAGEDDVTSASWEQWSTKTLFVNPPGRTRSYARLDLRWVEPVIGFYGQSFADSRDMTQKGFEIAITEAELGLERKSSKKEKAKWTERRDRAKAALGGLAQIPTQMRPGLAETNGEVVELSKELEGVSEISDLINEWKTEINRVATGPKQ